MNHALLQTFIECLGWTLLHFVWQGALIATLLAVVLRWSRDGSAAFRYFLSCAAMLLLVVGLIGTFNYFCQLAQDADPENAAVVDNPSSGDAPVIFAKNKFISITLQSGAVASFHERLAEALPFMVAAWAAGVLIFSFRLLIGWLQIRQLRQTVIYAIDDFWLGRFAELKARLGIRKPVRLLQSALVEVPIVIGWLKPMVLLPAGCLVGLSAAQLESILAHELAHIRRLDYPLNLLQNCLETLLFYHPAVWWISSRIREERENCCDDLAVEVCGNKVAYARALATLEELRQTPMPFALAANGGQLLGRVQRLIGKKNKNRSGWPLVVIALFLFVAGFAVDVQVHRAEAISRELITATATEVASPLSYQLQDASAKPLVAKIPLPQTPSAGTSSWEQVVRKIVERELSAEPVPTPVEIVANQALAQPSPVIPVAVPIAPVIAEGAVTNAHRLQINFQIQIIEVSNKRKIEWLYHAYLEKPEKILTNDMGWRLTNAIDGFCAIVLNPEQKKNALHDLENSDDVAELSAPGILTEMGRQAQISSATEIPILFTTNQSGSARLYSVVSNIPFGSLTDIIPKRLVAPDSIEIIVRSQVVDFLGYRPNREGRQSSVQMWTRAIGKDMVVKNGSTLVLAGETGGLPKLYSPTPDIPNRLIPRTWKPTPLGAAPKCKYFLVFITPFLMDEAGRRIEDLSSFYDHGDTPKQP